MTRDSQTEKPLTHIAGRQLVSVNEAAKAAGVHRRTIYEWMNEQRIEWVYTAGRARRVFVDSLFRLPELKKPDSSAA